MLKVVYCWSGVLGGGGGRKTSSSYGNSAASNDSCASATSRRERFVEVKCFQKGGGAG